MPFRSIMDLDAKGRRVFLRADLDVPIDHGAVTDPGRLRAALPTLRHLLAQGASVVLASRLGGGAEPPSSLAPVAAWLKAEGFDLRLASGVIGEHVEAEAAALLPGQVLLLENLETVRDDREDFARSLARLADTYVNDDFSATHRSRPSVSGMAPFFDSTRIAAGLLLERELKALDRIAREPRQPLVLVLGGTVAAEPFELIRHFLGRATTILIGGIASYTFLKAQGIPVGDSARDDHHLASALKLVRDAEAQGTRLLLPMDHVVAAEASPDAECEITHDQAIPAGKKGLDIGPETVAAYMQEIHGAGTILWSGAMGAFEVEPFASGTLAMAEEMAEVADRGAFVCLCGGESLSAAVQAGVAARMSHASTGGSASIEYLCGLELPGLATLPTRY